MNIISCSCSGTTTPRSENVASHILLTLLLIAILVILSGCSANPTRSAAMIPSDVQTARKYTKSVSITVSGGEKTDPQGVPRISNEAFQKAITEAIRNSQLFAAVVDGKSADYQLEAVIFSIEQPFFGTDMTADLEVGWTLSEVSTKKILWRKSIQSHYTEPEGGAFLAVERVRLAIEGAAKENIRDALEQISHSTEISALSPSILTDSVFF